MVTARGPGIHAYRIVSRWRLRGTARELAPVFEDAEGWARWWPAAFLQVRELPGVEPRTVRIHSKGWFPYTLRLDARAVACDYPRACTFQVRGDFEGRCHCRIEDRPDGLVDVSFDWQVRVRKPLLRALSFGLKPLLTANHRWVMRQGRRSLQIELDRRRGLATAPPPGPSFPYGRSRLGVAHLWRASAGALAAGADGRLDRTSW